MGGTGKYSTEDVDLSNSSVEKNGSKKGILKAIANMFGMNVDVVEKGEVKNKYTQRIIRDNFWSAFYTLSDCLLDSYNPETGKYEIVQDTTRIRDALEDFKSIVTDLLTSNEDVYKSIEKAGKKMRHPEASLRRPCKVSMTVWGHSWKNLMKIVKRRKQK